MLYKFQGIITLLLFAFGPQALRGKNLEENGAARKVLDALGNVLDFVESYPNQINIDGIVCVSMAQAQLEQIIINKYNAQFKGEIRDLIDQCDRLRQRILPPMVNLLPPSYKLFAKYLANASFWHHAVEFEEGLLADLGVYDPATMKQILSQNSLTYKKTSTDVCIGEVMGENERNPNAKDCHISPACETVILADRNDTAYLLTHRLFYLQIARQSNCVMEKAWMDRFARNFCSLILKESKTSELLGFPNHDILIEQVLFCGTEGFEEFLIPEWTDEIVSWQTPEGCYCNEKTYFRRKRNANTIVFGCNDHTTGLAAAALALNLRHILGSFDAYFM